MSAHYDKSTQRWRLHFQVNGQRHTKRGFVSKRAALDAEAECRRSLAENRSEPFLTFKHLVGAFLAASERTKSAAWAYQLEKKLNKGFAALAALRPREITRGHLEPLLDALRLQGNQARSVNEYRKIVIAVFNYAIEMGALTDNPAARIPRMPEVEADVEPIPRAHLQQLILAAEPRFQALLIFLSQTGARFIEAARLRGADVLLDRDPPVAILRTRKKRGGDERARPQPLTTLAVEVLRRVSGPADPHVFLGVSGGGLVYRTELGELHRLCGKLQLPAYSFHQIRHWAGSIAAGMGQNKKAVARFLGQSSTSSTDRYMHAQDPEVWAVAKRLEEEMRAIAATEEKTDAV